VPARRAVYTSKVKNAQEAHEAIRPPVTTSARPQVGELRGDEFALYDLIWKRTVASQMKDAEGETVSDRASARPWPQRPPRGGRRHHRRDRSAVAQAGSRRPREGRSRSRAS
jgi:hypothetical protein